MPLLTKVFDVKALTGAYIEIDELYAAPMDYLPQGELLGPRPTPKPIVTKLVGLVASASQKELLVAVGYDGGVRLVRIPLERLKDATRGAPYPETRLMLSGSKWYVVTSASLNEVED